MVGHPPLYFGEPTSQTILFFSRRFFVERRGLRKGRNVYEASHFGAGELVRALLKAQALAP